MHNKKNRDYKSLIETDDNNLQLVFLFITQELRVKNQARGQNDWSRALK